MYQMISILLMNHIIPVFVFDGKPPRIKDKVLDMRKNNRLKAIEKMKNAKTEKADFCT